MTILMDGQSVIATDPVYDVVYGPGVVSRIDDAAGIFHVRFGQFGKPYNGKGVTGPAGKRTLYWKNPVVFVPPKECAKWDVMIELARSMWPALSKLPLQEAE